MACQFKGQGFIGLLAGLTQLEGPAARTALLPELNPDLRLLVERDAILSSGWYPLAWYSELTTAIRRHHGPGVGLEIGRLGMRNDVNAFSRWILGLASPALLVALSGRLLRMYFQGAALDTKQSGPKEGRLAFSRLDGSCDATWDAIGGAITAFVELSGGSGVVTRITEGGGALDHCVFVVTWA